MFRLLGFFAIPFLIGLFSLSSQAQFLLTESEVINMAQKTSPVSQEIEAGKQANRAQEFAVKSQYDPKLQASYSYFSSKENAIIQFAPVFQPQKLFNLGVSQKTSLGTTINTQVYSQQISTANGLIDNATQVGVQLGVEIDIWKNILGRLDRSQLKSAKINQKISSLQANIDQHSFVLDVRKLYWSLVANELSLNLSQELVKTATSQWAESKKKLREGLGDSGDVARNQAQLESRKSSVLFFSYQKELMIGQLKSMLPFLNAKTISLDGREAQDIEGAARRCMGEILAQNKMDPQYSRFDDIVGLLDEQQDHEMRLAKSTDSFDVKLKARYQASGVDNSHDAAYNQLTDQFRNGYEVGVALQVPLGGDLSRSQASQVSATQNRFEAQKSKISLQLKSEHQKIQKAISLLVGASKSQGATVDSLRTSLKRTQKKYRQARVSLNTYVLEQDNLFGSELQLIDTKRQILHLLLDYFKLFSNHPCELNQLQGVQS